jgi:hypothetical protein
VQVTCTSADRFCHEVHVRVEEHEPSRISSVRFEGNALSEELTKKVQESRANRRSSDDYDSSGNREKLVVALRNEGYIAARISRHTKLVIVQALFESK